MTTPSSQVTEPAREVPVLGEWDVVVCGGGPAGCAAAISAARHGAKTLLVEKEGFLGGSPCTQLVCVILSTNGADFQGIWHEYITRLRQADGVRPFLGAPRNGHIRSAVDPERVKLAWDGLCEEAGVTLLHHAYGARGILENGVVRGVFMETRAGRRAAGARIVIDTTGDGIVAAESGVPFDQGDGVNPWAMALTQVFRMGNVRKPANWPDDVALRAVDEALAAALDRGEFTSPVLAERKRFLNYLRAWCWEMPGGRTELLSVLSRVLRVDPIDPWDITRAAREGREQARQGAEAMIRFAPGFEAAYLLDTGSQIGIRSSRRLRGLATVSDEDAWDFRHYADGIARSSWDVDVWPADSYSKPAVPRGEEHYKGRQEAMANGAWFDIRYGCLVPQGVDNLLTAGRCLSASHLAESSLRIQQTCMATGQAAGTAAALCIKKGTTPRELDPMTVVEQLAKDRAAVTPAVDFNP